MALHALAGDLAFGLFVEALWRRVGLARRLVPLLRGSEVAQSRLANFGPVDLHEGQAGLDEVALRGAMRWRLDPSAMRAGDTTMGRQHLIKFFQDARVSRRVEPYSAFWKEL